MSEMTLQDLAKKMADIDFAMLVTRTEHGQLASRPMSNNGQVDLDADSYYFTWQESRMADDIAHDPVVALTFAGDKSLFGGPPLFVSVEGRAELIHDQTQFAAHWTRDLDHWFEDGVDTPGLTMIKVRASRVHYWAGEDEGEFVVRP